MAKKKGTEAKAVETEKTQEKTTALSDENQDIQDEKVDEDKSEKPMEPVALLVRLREIHPQASYGRAGCRFNKDTAVKLALVDLTQAQLDTLLVDPWLEIEGLME